MLKIYGSMLCPDCVQCRSDLDKAGISYEYLDFSDRLQNLKEFLMIRDSDEAFLEIKKNGKIGVPCLVRPDGAITFHWDDLM